MTCLIIESLAEYLHTSHPAMNGTKIISLSANKQETFWRNSDGTQLKIIPPTYFSCKIAGSMSLYYQVSINECLTLSLLM
jgi:hypothetical protein